MDERMRGKSEERVEHEATWSQGSHPLENPLDYRGYADIRR